MVAQIARDGPVRDLADFARKLDRHLFGRSGGEGS
jgi:hypothetical protein